MGGPVFIALDDSLALLGRPTWFVQMLTRSIAEGSDNVLIFEVEDVRDVTILMTATPGIAPPVRSDIGSTDENDNLFILASELPFEEELLFGSAA